MAMVPYERSLVKRLEGKPFVLLGVDLDSSKEVLKQTEEEKQMAWRSWFDGRRGPIAKRWNIRFLPKIYVLDTHGVIRYKDVHEKQLDEAVDTLLKEAQAGARR